MAWLFVSWMYVLSLSDRGMVMRVGYDTVVVESLNVAFDC